MVQMLRLWGKIIKSNKIKVNIEAACDENIEFQQQLKKCIIEICNTFDIQKPYWLPKNLEEFNRRGKTSFNQDNFIEEIEFDRFEIEVIDEEKIKTQGHK
jgi:hypothetical protein